MILTHYRISIINSFGILTRAINSNSSSCCVHTHYLSFCGKSCRNLHHINVITFCIIFLLLEFKHSIMIVDCFTIKVEEVTYKIITLAVFTIINRIFIRRSWRSWATRFSIILNLVIFTIISNGIRSLTWSRNYLQGFIIIFRNSLKRTCQKQVIIIRVRSILFAAFYNTEINRITWWHIIQFTSIDITIRRGKSEIGVESISPRATIIITFNSDFVVSHHFEWYAH